MQRFDLLDGSVRLAGVLDAERTADGAVLRRLPAWTRHQIVDPTLAFLVSMPSGARLELLTDAEAIELDVMLTLMQIGDAPVVPAAFDLVVDNRLVEGQTTSEGTVVAVDLRTGVPDIRPGLPTTVRFEGLPPIEKHVEIWLPHAAALELRGFKLSDGAAVAPPLPSGRRRWVHYGSSISHCLEADRPTGVWPVVAARQAGVDLQSLAFAGQCQLDQLVARTIRDLEVDLVSLKVGINVVNADSMRERTFVPAVHGFLDTIRDGHPEVPLLVVTPILFPAGEDHPGPTVPGPDGRFVGLDRSPELAVGALTIGRIRQLLADVVAARRGAGDGHLHLLDGRTLFGVDDVVDLPDGLHPNSDGYRRIGERFHAAAFGAGGPFA